MCESGSGADSQVSLANDGSRGAKENRAEAKGISLSLSGDIDPAARPQAFSALNILGSSLWRSSSL
jgi:hypothetical protein